MAYSPKQTYPGATEADPNYQGDKFKNNSQPTVNDGSPLRAEDRNQRLALDEAVMNAAGMKYNGQADTPQDSQMFAAYKAALGNGANLLSNHNFLIPSPDDSQPAPDATPRSYPAGFEVFAGVFANETTGVSNLTYINGRVSFSGGDINFEVSNNNGLDRVTDFVASVADFEGKPRTRGVSFSLVGNSYRVTVGVDALTDTDGNDTFLGSVKLEQGLVATGHDVGSLSLWNLADHTDLVFDSVDDAKSGGSLSESMLNSRTVMVETKSYYDTSAGNKPLGGAKYLASSLVYIRNSLGDPSWIPDGYGSNYISGIGSGTDYVIYLLGDVLDLYQYGFKLDGTDETAKFNAIALDGRPVVQSGGNLGVKDAQLLTIDFECSSNSKITCLTPDGLGDAYDTFKITGDDARVIINGTLDCNNSGITSFNFTGHNPDFYLRKSINCSIKSGSSTFTGVALFTGNNSKFKGYGEQFLRNGVSFTDIPAAPRLFTVQGTAEDYYCEYSITKGATDNFVVGASTISGRCDLVYSTGCLDNSVYHLGGKLSLGAVHHIDGQDEVVVSEGDLSCDSITVRGYALSVIGWQNASRVTISKIDWDDEGKKSSSGQYSGNIFRQRPLNTSSGRVKIGNIDAKYTGNNLCSVGSGNGTTDRLTVSNMDVLFRADTNNSGLNMNSWMALNGVRSFAIKDWTVNIFDVNGTFTSSDRFEGSAGTLSGPTTWDSIKIQTTNSSGFGSHGFRFRNAAQEFFESYGAVWQASIPSIEGSNFSASSGVDMAESYPTSGTWNAGKTLHRRNLNPTSPEQEKAVKWQCVTSGSPGQWVQESAKVVNVP